MLTMWKWSAIPQQDTSEDGNHRRYFTSVRDRVIATFRELGIELEFLWRGRERGKPRLHPAATGLPITHR